MSMMTANAWGKPLKVTPMTPEEQQKQQERLAAEAKAKQIQEQATADQKTAERLDRWCASQETDPPRPNGGGTFKEMVTRTQFWAAAALWGNRSTATKTYSVRGPVVKKGNNLNAGKMTGNFEVFTNTGVRLADLHVLVDPNS